MFIIHVVNDLQRPRIVASGLDARLRVMPAVVVTGARQTGKSTLAQNLDPGIRRFLTLDDPEVVHLAQRDPAALLGGSQPVTLDEVQREPRLLLAVKGDIDRDRQPGKFLLTGSANLLLMNRVSESLAGRASYLTLWPMTRREQLGFGLGGIWQDLLDTPADDWLDLAASQPNRREGWRELAFRGGFPTPALHLETAEDRAIWFDGYVTTYLERVLKDISNIAALSDFRRLMRAACHRIGQLVNQTELGRDVGLPQPTVRRYLDLLETSYALVRLPAYAVNRTKRLMKSPKLYWADTGVALHLSQERQPRGAHLENLVLNDLLAWRDARVDRPEILYWRTSLGDEVDFVIEGGDRLLPIEVKATARPSARDAVHLRTFRAEYEDRCTAGLLLHDGETIDWVAPDVLAAPWWRVI